MTRPISPRRNAVLLVHGGLWGDMDAHRFWTKPGVTNGIRREGFTTLAPNRLHRPRDWDAEAEHLAAFLPEPPVVVVAGSNGCSAGVRLALAFPNRITRVLLAWPATAGDSTVDRRTRAGLAALGASDQNVIALLDGQTLRGVTDDELATLTMPVGVLPSAPENPFHQRRTVDALRRLLPANEELLGAAQRHRAPTSLPIWTGSSPRSPSSPTEKAQSENLPSPQRMNARLAPGSPQPTNALPAPARDDPQCRAGAVGVHGASAGGLQ